MSEGFHTRKGSSQKIPKKTTRGWELLVEWKDGSMDWIRLANLKESYPVQIAEYAVANGIDHEPAFKCWVLSILRRRDRIISKVKSKNIGGLPISLGSRYLRLSKRLMRLIELQKLISG